MLHVFNKEVPKKTYQHVLHAKKSLKIELKYFVLVVEQNHLK
jgi:hypothetical protein